MVCAAGRSWPAVPVLFLVVWFCGLYRWALYVLKSSLALWPRFSICFSILITSLGEEGPGLRVSRAFCVCFACVCLPLVVECWLRFVIVAYPGPFY